MIQHTTMALAFANASCGAAACNNGLYYKVLDCLDRYAKSRKAGKDWTAKLSYRTARYLGSKGVPLQ